MEKHRLYAKIKTYPADSIFGKLVFRPDGESPPGRTGCADAGFLRPQAAPRYISTLPCAHRLRLYISAAYGIGVLCRPDIHATLYQASGPPARQLIALLPSYVSQIPRRRQGGVICLFGSLPAGIRDKIGIRKGILLWEIHRFGNIVPGNSARILSCLSG